MILLLRIRMLVCSNSCNVDGHGVVVSLQEWAQHEGSREFGHQCCSIVLLSTVDEITSWFVLRNNCWASRYNYVIRYTFDA